MNNEMKFVAEWLYKEQNPDYIEKALKDLPRTYGKSGLKDFEMSMHSQTPKSLSRKDTPEDEAELNARSLPRKKDLGPDHEINLNGEPSPEKYEKPDVDSDLDNEEDEDHVLDLDSNLKNNQKKLNTAGRSSVSAEAYGQHNKKQEYKPKYIHKGLEVKKSIQKKLMESFMFRYLEEKDMEIILDAMDIKRLK